MCSVWVHGFLLASAILAERGDRLSAPYRRGPRETHYVRIVDAEYAMFESERLDPAHRKVCYILLAIGAGMLAFSLYMGFVQHANSAVVFISLGLTTAVFGTVLFMLLKPHAFAFLSPATAVPEPKAEPPPEANNEAQSEAKDAPALELEDVPPPDSNDVQPLNSKAAPRPEIGAEPPAQVKAQIGREAKSEPQDEASTDVVTPLDMTLGDILLAALRKDPQGAGRIFARAIVQADVAIAAAKAGEPKTEVQPHPADMSPARRGPNDSG